MEQQQKSRKKRKKQWQEGEGIYLAATGAIVVGIIVSIISLFLPSFSFLPYPCLFKEILHVYCPGCGGTRAFLELTHFHFVDSVMSNPLVIYLAVLFAYYYIGTTLAILCKGKKVFFHPHMWMFVVGGVIIVLNFFIRNYLAIFKGIDYLGDIALYWR